jgi:hypothetical protein
MAQACLDHRHFRVVYSQQHLMVSKMMTVMVDLSDSLDLTEECQMNLDQWQVRCRQWQISQEH